MDLPIKVAFLDRDGVINENRPEMFYYVTKPSQFVFNEGIFSVLGRLWDDGFKFIVITNQRGIARGMLTEEGLSAIHEHMRQGLKDRGIELLDVLVCPHGSDECSCRKPKPGLLEEAMRKYDIDLPASILISDSREEVEMGREFGIGKNIYIEKNKPESFFDYYSNE